MMISAGSIARSLSLREVSQPGLPRNEVGTTAETQRDFTRLRTLIVDDQLMAREVLRRLLQNEPDVDIIGMPASGREAVTAINALAPDLVFLDVRMPELDGFGVLAEINPARMPIIIFVTANDDFAVRAFEVHALDFLVKPVSRERFQNAVQRAREQLLRRQSGELHHGLVSLLQELKSPAPVIGRLPVKSDGRVVFVSLNDLGWIQAADNYVEIHVGTETHLLRETMAALECRLPSDRFLRISRSVIVNVEHIKELHPMFHGEYTVVLRGGARLTLTRSYRDKLQSLGLA